MKKSVLLILMLVFISSAYSQQKVVYGKVDFKTFPVKNVIIKSKKSGASVTSDIEGKFVIACEKNDVLIFETKNFNTVKKRPKGKDSLFVHLELKRGVINKEGILENEYMSKDNLVMALNKAENEDNEYIKYNTVYEVIAAKFPGVEVSSSGEVIIRGRSSVASIMSNAALFVVNGTVVRDISHIMPAQIKSIKLLRGPAQGSTRYGSGSENGVVVITTK